MYGLSFRARRGAGRALTVRSSLTVALLASIAACTEPEPISRQDLLSDEAAFFDASELMWSHDIGEAELAELRTGMTLAAQWDRRCVLWRDDYGDAVRRQGAAARFLDLAAIQCEHAAIGELLDRGVYTGAAQKMLEDTRLTMAFAGLLAGLPLDDEVAEACAVVSPSRSVSVSAGLARRRISQAVAVGALDPSVLDAAKERDRMLGPLCSRDG